MLISLLRREPAWWQLRQIILGDLVPAVALAMMAIFETVDRAQVGRSPDQDHQMSFVLLSIALACFFMNANLTQPWRQGGFERGLPVPLRTQWLARTISLTFSGFVPLILMCAVTELGSAWISHEVLALLRRDIAGLAAGWLLIVALLQGLAGGHPAARWATWGRGRSVATTFTLIASAFAVVALCLAWKWFPWVAAFSGAAILGGAAVRMPQAVDLMAATTRPAIGGFAAFTSSARPGSVRRCLRRLTVTDLRAVPYLTVLLAIGFLIGSPFAEGDGPIPAMSVMFVPLFLWAATIWGGRLVLRMGLALPLSRRRLFAWTVLPPLVAVGLGMTAGWGLSVYWGEYRGVHGERVAVAYRFRTPAGWVVEVPARCWRLAWRNPPMLRSEVAAVLPRTFPVLAEGLPLVAYHPYDAGTGPSGALLAAQMSRAVQDVLGISVPRQELERRYFAQPPESRVWLDTEILIRDYDLIGNARTRWGAMWTSLALLWFLCLFAAVGPPVTQLSPRVGRPRVELQTYAILFGPAFVLLMLSSLLRKEATLAALGSFIRLVDLCVPADPLLALPVLGALFAGAFLFHERRFARMDMPAPLANVDPLRGKHL